MIYEYQAQVIPFRKEGAPVDIAGALNEQGSQGWRLIHVEPAEVNRHGERLCIWEREVVATEGNGLP